MVHLLEKMTDDKNKSGMLYDTIYAYIYKCCKMQ